MTKLSISKELLKHIKDKHEFIRNKVKDLC